MKRHHLGKSFWFVLFASAWKVSSENYSYPSSPSTRITLPQGYVTGVTIFTDSSAKVNAYLGLPYALPPIGDLRFAPPERHPGWNRTLFAGHFRPDCLQIRQDSPTEQEITNEDCLYLNVFAPDEAMTYRNFPVVVFIHGSDYVLGSPLTVNAEELAREGLVVVTFSYRLNVFGFLTFEDEFARGNLGLLDQYMALVWVKNNIQYFGGTPDEITLMGHGSGASSILVHMTSPRTKNLFQKAILMSGSLFSPWLRSHPRSDSHPALSTSRAIARSLGCYGESYHGRKSGSVLACLRQKNGEEILKAFQSAYKNGNWTDALGPISDDFLPPGDQYLPADPTEAVKSGNYHRMPLMTGITSNEGTFTLNNWRDLINQNEESIDHFVRNTAVGNVLEMYRFRGPEARNLINWKYLNKFPKSQKRILQLLQLYNEAMYEAPFWLQTETLSKNNEGNPVFVYVFAQPSPGYLGNYVDLLNLKSSSHGSDLVFLFGPSLFQKVAGRRFTATEERLNVRMKKFLTNFVRFGNPSPSSSYGYNVWTEYSGRDGEIHLRFQADPETGRNSQRFSGNPNREGSTFWNSLLPGLEEMRERREKRLEEMLEAGKNSNLRGESGACASYKSAMFTSLGFLILLLIMLVFSLLFLKKRTKERNQCVL